MKKYKITVSEPWDFEGFAGDNLILGEVLKIISPVSLLFKSDYLLTSRGQIGRILFLKSRYEKQVLVQENGIGGTVGGGLLCMEDYEEQDEKYLESNSQYIFIGRLEEK